MSFFSSTARHRAERETPLKTMAIITSAAAGAVLLALGGSSTTLAHWADGAPMSAGSISTGSLELQVNGAASLVLPANDPRFLGMMPGDHRQGAVTLSTTGNVATDLTASATTTIPGDYEIRVGEGNCGTAVLAPIASADLGGFPAGAASKMVCVDVTLPLSAPSRQQGLSSVLTVTFTATQRVV